MLNQLLKKKDRPTKKNQAFIKRVMPVCFTLSVCLFSSSLIAKNELIGAEKPLNSSQLNIVLQTELLAMQQATITLHQKKFSFPNGKLPESLINDIDKNNKQNSKRLLSIIETYGWPNINLVGLKGRDAAFVIVQQAEPALQTALLPILKNEFEQGQLSGPKLASLIDNNLIKLGKKQRYGTQLAIVNGQIVFNEIEDEETLDQKRIKMNMMPMAQYKRLLSKMYKLD